MINKTQSIVELKHLFNKISSYPDVEEIVGARDQVLEAYSELFKLHNVKSMKAGDFRSFLLFRENRHWTNLHRKGSQVTENMESLQDALCSLADDTKPVDTRINKALTHKYLGHATASAILLIMYPSKYGVWNNTSEKALKILGEWPEFARGNSQGKRYAKINEGLRALAHGVGIDLWTLDALLWQVAQR
jgi:hypothetical protein